MTIATSPYFTDTEAGLSLQAFDDVRTLIELASVYTVKGFRTAEEIKIRIDTLQVLYALLSNDCNPDFLKEEPITRDDIEQEICVYIRDLRSSNPHLRIT